MLVYLQSFGDSQLAAAKFFLGSAYNEEIESAMDSVFTFLNTLDWHYQDLYESGCLKRLAQPNYVVHQASKLPT